MFSFRAFHRATAEAWEMKTGWRWRGGGVFVLREGGGALMLFHCHWTVKHRWEPYHVLTLSRDKTLYNKKKKKITFILYH